MKSFTKIAALGGLTMTMLVAMLASPAFAHVSAEHLVNPTQSSFGSGFFHPLMGADHILAMLVVGIWAVQLGGRALWQVPCAFVGAMGLGFILALSGLTLPFIEAGILASVIVLGLVATFAVRLPILYAMGIVGLFALFHGAAHGGEMGNASALTYGLGFALATMVLHGAGLGLGVGASRLAQMTRQMLINRAMGFVALLSGLYLLIAG